MREEAHHLPTHAARCQADVAAANPVSGTNLLYTLHFYACAHAASARAVGDTAMSKGVALFISELGLTPADGGVPPNNKVCESEANLWFDWMASCAVTRTVRRRD